LDDCVFLAEEEDLAELLVVTVVVASDANESEADVAFFRLRRRWADIPAAMGEGSPPPLATLNINNIGWGSNRTMNGAVLLTSTFCRGTNNVKVIIFSDFFEFFVLC